MMGSYATGEFVAVALRKSRLLVDARLGCRPIRHKQAGHSIKKLKWTLGSAVLMMGTPSVGSAPFHQSIPVEFHGLFAPTAAGCRSDDGVEAISVAADGIHYYEGDDYLVIGVGFSGSSTKSGKMIPLFNGRFTGRVETQLLGEVNVRLEMESPNVLIRYVLKPDGEPDSNPVNTWVRCFAGSQRGG